MITQEERLLINRFLDENYIQDFEEDCCLGVSIKGSIPKRKLKLEKVTIFHGSAPRLEEPVCDGSVPPKKLEDMLKDLDKTFQQYMFEIIDSKGMEDVDVYKRAHLQKQLFSKIRSNVNFKPSKKTALSLCIGLKLDYDECQNLLDKAGFTLSKSSISDCIVEYFIRKGDFNLMHINDALYDYNQPILM